MSVRILVGDCLERMRELEPESIDAVVTDPPYGLGFMGKEWDTFTPANVRAEKDRDTRSQSRRELYGGKGSDKPSAAMAAARYDRSTPANVRFQEGMRLYAVEALRVAKPGAHLVAFGGPRTFHRLTCAIEDAGWEIRDCLGWFFGSGFPKSHNLDGERLGWGTALKPGWEPIVLARKPLIGTVAKNVTQYGTGGLNVDGCRIPHNEECRVMAPSQANIDRPSEKHRQAGRRVETLELKPSGRWPANVCLDEEAAGMLDEQTGTLSVTGKRSAASQARWAEGESPLVGSGATNRKLTEYGGDTGGASRFFYTAKASRREREAGLEGMERKLLATHGATGPAADKPNGQQAIPAANHHPTVKPIALMRWLARLVTPPGGRILDPFAGSGTTGCAAALEGFDAILVEREAEYVPIIEARVAHWTRVAAELPMDLFPPDRT